MGKPGEALIRTPLKELVPQIDATHFYRCTDRWSWTCARRGIAR
jgi:hypothetical protein